MKVVAFGAHPDDIEVGMGGTIARYTGAKHEVVMVVAAIPSKKTIRWKEAEEAASILGAELVVLDMDAEELGFSRQLVRKFDEVLARHAPDAIYTQWNHDSHQDHVAVSNAVIAAARKNNCSLYMYEQTIPGGIVPFAFRPQSFVDVSDVMEVKARSVMAHQSQVERNGDWWLHGITGRATYRGYQINVSYAEAFEVVKELRQI